MNARNWQWWHFVLAGIGIGGWSVWRVAETGSLRDGSGLVLAAICIGFGVLSRGGGGRVRTAARRHLDRMKAMYAAPHDHVRVDLGEFGHLDRTFYPATTAELQAEGFRLLGDTEDSTLARLNADTVERCCERRLVGDEGTVRATVFHVKPRSKAAFEQRVVSFVTELSDGRSVATGSQPPNKFPSPPEVDVARFPGIGATALLAMHRDRVRAAMAHGRGCSRVIVRSLDEALDRERRALARQAEHLRSVGWLTRDFILAHAKPGQEAGAEALYREVQALVAQEG